MVSAYSILSSIIFFNIALAVVCLLRRNTVFLVRYSVSVLLLLSGFSLLRLFVPLEPPGAYVVVSETVVPKVRNFLLSDLIPGVSWLHPYTVLLVIWLIGALVFALRDLCELAQERKRRRHFRLVEDRTVRRIADELAISVPVLITPDISIPYAAGIFRHTICFPYKELSEEDISFMLRHEMQHIRGHDSWIKLFVAILRDLFWWNVPVHPFFRDLDAMLEIRCDARVTADMDEAAQRRYLGTVVNLMDPRNRLSSRVTAAVSPLLGQPNELRQRFYVLYEVKKRRPAYIRALIYGLVVVAFVASYMVILQPVGAPPEDGKVRTIIISSELSDEGYIEKIDGRYIAYMDGLPCSFEVAEDMLNMPPFNEMPIIERNETP